MQTTQKITIKEIVEAAILIGLYVAITIGILENDVFKNFYFYILFIFVIALIIPDLINLRKKDMFIDEE